jgi:ribosomal protein S25
MIDKNKAVWEQVAERVRDYPYGAGRSQIAADFGVTVSTARIHLEKGVKRGLLVKSFTWVKKNSRGWVYMAADAENTPLPHVYRPEGFPE